MTAVADGKDEGPEWEREPVTMAEACEIVLDEAYDIEAFQRRTYQGASPSPKAMRRAHVMRYAASIMQIVHENSEEFKAMIVAKRAKQAKARMARGSSS